MIGRESRGGGPQAWSVGALLLAVSDALAARFSAVTVRGELSGFTRASSGHCYFTLKDAGGAGASMRCAMFRRSAQMLGFAPRDGQQVEIRGRLAVYEARGELQMVAEAMQVLGAGGLYEEFLRLRARLEAQGLFSAECKRPLPAHPRCIALVTSLAGAALHDVLTTLQRRVPHVAVHVYPSLVQGAEAPPALVVALEAAASDPLADLVILCRGGGSLEDLWAFNDERVVRAVADCPLPIVCGVGHETDITLADLAADLRAATPTAAAELVATTRDELMRDLTLRAQWMSRHLSQRLDNAQQRIDTLSLRLQRPGHLVAAQSGRLDALADRHRATLRRVVERAGQQERVMGARLLQAGLSALQHERMQWESRRSRLEALDPRRVLARGYAWMADDQGRPVVSSQALALGQCLRAVWSDGEAGVVVREIGPVVPSDDHTPRKN